ncbi:hypothetical protein NCC49_005890 [Naganishia albida]|nr:hypothetical protein NCC49_005890 [Naganishia albida]
MALAAGPRRPTATVLRAICIARHYAATVNSPLPSTNPSVVPEKPETRSLTQDPLDDYIDVYQRIFLQPGAFDGLASLTKLYSEYRSNAGHILDRVLPYEAYPSNSRRSDVIHATSRETIGDGVVLVVHVLQGLDGHIEKMSVCSGFAVAAEQGQAMPSDVIVTCAHTLEEMRRHLLEPFAASQPSCSFVIPSEGKPRLIASVLSSLPRSDLAVFSTIPSKHPLTTLPVTPFPLALGASIYSHTFGSPDIPIIKRAKNRQTTADTEAAETPISWLSGKAWRRWGSGQLLGYRSYTGFEVEAGTASQLPHLLTSILPSPGSSGGPIIDSSTGAVVGVISGRRMDNRVEGERGWGAAAEGIFEMFAMPGFVPASKRR